MIAPWLMILSAILTFAGTSLSSPLSSNVLTLPSFNQSDLSALNASAFNLSDTFDRFPVQGTPITLDLYAYEEDIPRSQLYATLSAAAVLIQATAEEYPTRTITSGKWIYEHNFKSGAKCTFKVDDLRESGKPLTYSKLFNVLQGLIAFSYDKQRYTTLYFLVDIKPVGLSAAGHIEYVKAPSTAAAVDVT